MNDCTRRAPEYTEHRAQRAIQDEAGLRDRRLGRFASGRDKDYKQL